VLSTELVVTFAFLLSFIEQRFSGASWGAARDCFGVSKHLWVKTKLSTPLRGPAYGTYVAHTSPWMQQAAYAQAAFFGLKAVNCR
jgi:hypothetical protein